MPNNMLRKGLVFGIIVLFIGSCVVPTISGTDRAIIYVDDDNTQGPWDGTLEHPYQHIRDGIDAANPGDTVFVFNGTYTERVSANVNRIKIIGQDRDTTIIQEPDDGGSNFVIHMTGKDDVTIDSFWIRSTVLPDTDAMGIRAAYSTNIDIINCKVTECGEGIQLYESSDCRIMKCIAYNNHYTATDNIGNGISLDEESHNNLIMDCICYNNSAHSLGDGIDLNPESSGNTIINCTCYDNQDDGISIDSDNNTIINSTCYGNGGTGIFTHTSNDNKIVNCNLYDNNYGIYLFRSTNNNISGNSIADNKQVGVYLRFFSSENNIRQNNFLNNTKDAFFFLSLSNTWNQNYWGKTRLLPKPIFGLMGIIPWVNLDWHPAKEPYDI